MPHLVATSIYLSQIYSYYIRGDRSPLRGFTLLISRSGGENTIILKSF